MEKIIINLICFIIIFSGGLFLYGYYNENGTIDTILDYYKRDHTVLTQNPYTKNPENKFVQITDDFEPDNKQDLLNIYYTVLSRGMDKFTFFCSKEYEHCITDVQGITADNMLLSHINNFIHIFNSYKSVKTEYTNGGKITININKIYDEEKVEAINKKMDELYNTIVKDNKSPKENIRSVHDYIINNSKYDVEYVNNNSPYASNNAYGPLLEGHAICSGYADLMSLFLDRMKINNHKVSNKNHVWNLVNINDEWLHLDLTWDDPLVSNGEDYLRHDYFLVDTKKLLELDTTEHTFEEEIYLH